ncbi:MAG TPA: FAD binding domain-containing protein [Oligoflexus sp.]|uniref:xanthine dehydrogenase small subunit n=1 Tax=Oligoflexus sp. TaxID=1971216 RepID=UPI002D7E6244|nr:FAD binding domain-containing protein [Oligoflexus sp.]HET9239495.1 FAD binding domain-containing protein [Oligoflexus sp.]
MSTRSFLRFSLNGSLQEVSGSEASMMLADWLRTRLYLTGTKIVCAEGDCGACTVLRAFPGLGRARDLRFEPINACITMLAQIDGSHLVTVDALSQDKVLAPVQEAMVQAKGSQCGYCTPGFVMALCGLFESCSTKPDEQTVKNHLTGNLCRCTGYTPIVAAAMSLDPKALPPLAERFVTRALAKALKESLAQPIAITTDQGKIFAPVKIADVSTLLKKYPKAMILASGTDLGVQINKGKRALGDVISLHLIPELYESGQKGAVYQFGAKVNLEEVRRRCDKGIPEFSSLLNVFASPQIKHSATLVGNIANASPIGDTLPFLLVVDGRVAVAKKEIPLTELFQGYRKMALKSGEWIRAVSFRAPQKTEVLRLYKAATRKDLDISTVSAAFLFDFKKSRKDNRPVIQSARVAFGGVAAIPLRIKRLEDWLKDKVLDASVVEAAHKILQEEIEPLSDLRGSAAYRRILVQGFFQQYCDEIMQSQELSHVHS